MTNSNNPWLKSIFNGKRFLNPNNVVNHSFKDFINWRFKRSKLKWPDFVPINYDYQDKTIENSTGKIKITFINHVSFLIQIDGINIITDPIWSERTSPLSFAGPKRVKAPGIKFEDLPKIDLVLISHNHYDHLDLPSVKMLYEKFDPLFICGLNMAKHDILPAIKQARICELDWWEEKKFTNIAIDYVPAQHWSKRRLFDTNKSLWGGFVIKTKMGNIYFAGDSGYSDLFKIIKDKYQNFIACLLPIGAYKPEYFMQPMHMSPHESVLTHQDLNSPLSIAMHYGTFPLADDNYHEPVNDLEKALKENKIENFIVLEHGQAVNL